MFPVFLPFPFLFSSSFSGKKIEHPQMTLCNTITILSRERRNVYACLVGVGGVAFLDTCAEFGRYGDDICVVDGPLVCLVAASPGYQNLL